MSVRKIVAGDLIHRPSVLNRPIEDVLTGSGYLVDGSNFAGFANYPVVTSETGVTNTLYAYGDVRRYGAAVDGVTDDTSHVNSAGLAMQAIGGGVVVIPVRTLWTPSSVSFQANVLYLDYSTLTSTDTQQQGLRYYGNGNVLLSILSSASRAGALRRNAGTPAQGGRVLIHDQLWIEDDLWADEGIQMTTWGVVGSSTLSVQGNPGDSTITVVDATFTGTDHTIHLVNGSAQIDRPRITAKVGNVLTLDAPLQYTHTIGETVKDNPWKGSIFPIVNWDTPGGWLNMGALQDSVSAAVNSQTIALSNPYVIYSLLIHQLFSDFILSGGNVQAAGGMNLTVPGGTFSRAGYMSSCSGQTVTVTTADPTNPRLDIVVWNNNGVAKVLAGTPAVSPVAPTPSSSQTLLATISVAAGASSIVTGNITDSRRRSVRMATLDPANGGWMLGNDDNNIVEFKLTAAGGFMRARFGGSLMPLDLAHEGQGVAFGGGTPLKKTMVYTPTITPASVAAASAPEQTFTVTGLTTADKVTVNPPAPANNIAIGGVRVSAADTLAIQFVNPTAGALTPTSGTYTVLAFRS